MKQQEEIYFKVKDYLMAEDFKNKAVKLENEEKAKHQDIVKNQIELNIRKLLNNQKI